jgi:4-amino-4-deoxy-L-arabinose transferase-like glycosyltransferase
VIFKSEPPAPAPLTRRDYWILGAILAAFVLMAGFAAAAKAASNDEGFFANQSWTLATEGRMAVTIMIDKVRPGAGIDHRAYWIAPLQPVLQAGWFLALGRSLFAMRCLTIIFGVVALVAFFLFLDRLSGRRAVGLTGTGILGLSYVFLDTGSYGRMDMMAAALGLSGWAVYICWRRDQFDRAVLLSQTLIVLSGMTHWCGLLWALGLVLLTVGWDFQRLRLRHLGLAAIPYAVGALAWGAYIWQDPAEFRRQFFANATASGRMSGLSAPWMGVWREFVERYPISYGLRSHTAGNRGPIFLKACILAAYVGAILANLFWKQLRERPERNVLLVLTAVFFLLHGVLEGQKLSLYLIHIVPLYTALLALLVFVLWEQRTVPRWLTGLALAGVLLIDAGGMAYRIRQNPIGTNYLPVGQALRQYAPPGSIVYGHNSLYFTIDDHYKYRDDSYLGFQDGKVPDYYIMEETWHTIHAEQEQLQSDLWRHIEKLRKQSRLLYQNAVYAVYAIEKR